MGRPVLALEQTRNWFLVHTMTRQLLLLVCCTALAVNARKFCPKERNGDECRAKQDQYKCGVFFKDLTSKVPLAWLGALPEAVVRARKEGATDDDVIRWFPNFNLMAACWGATLTPTAMRATSVVIPWLTLDAMLR